jgi:hypothetical protein
MNMRQSYTAVVERNASWSGDFAVEPYEAAWATEAIYFIRALEAEDIPSDAVARVQLSPDGIQWCDEGMAIGLPTTKDGLTFGRVTHFGGWLRLVGKLPDSARLKVIVYLALKE